MTNKDEAIRLRLRTIWLARPKDFWQEIDSLLDGVIGIARRIDKDDWDEKIHLGDLVQNYIVPWVDDKLAREEHVERNVVDGDLVRAAEALERKMRPKEMLEESIQDILRAAPPRTYMPVLTEELNRAMRAVERAVTNGRVTEVDGVVVILPEHASRFNAIYGFWGKECLDWGQPKFTGKTWAIFQSTALPEDAYYLFYQPITGREQHFVMFLSNVLEQLDIVNNN